MTNKMTIGKVIRDHIKHRGKTIKIIASEIKTNEKTLYDELNNDRISAKKLLVLSEHLDIDLEWLKNMFTISTKSYYQRIVAKRMTNSYKHERAKEVYQFIDNIANSTCDTEFILNELISYFGSEFFILDALLDESWEIRAFAVGLNEKFEIKNTNISCFDCFTYNDGRSELLRIIKDYLNSQEIKEEITFSDIQNIYLKTSTIDEEDIISQGMYYHNKRNYTAAINCFEHALSLNSSGDARRLLGTVYYAEGKTSEAITEFEKALSINSDDDFVLNNLLELYISTKQYREALNTIEKIMSSPIIFSDLAVDELHARKFFILITLGDKEKLSEYRYKVLPEISDNDLKNHIINETERLI